MLLEMTVREIANDRMQREAKEHMYTPSCAHSAATRDRERIVEPRTQRNGSFWHDRTKCMVLVRFSSSLTVVL